MHAKLRFLISIIIPIIKRFIIIITSNTITNMSMTRNFEAVWNAAINLKVPTVECSRSNLPCSLHPDLCPVKKGVKGEKVIRAAMCNARDVIKRSFQEQFKSRIGIRFLLIYLKI